MTKMMIAMMGSDSIVPSIMFAGAPARIVTQIARISRGGRVSPKVQKPEREPLVCGSHPNLAGCFRALLRAAECRDVRIYKKGNPVRLIDLRPWRLSLAIFAVRALYRKGRKGLATVEETVSSPSPYFAILPRSPKSEPRSDPAPRRGLP